MHPHPIALIAGLILLAAATPANAARSYDSCTGTIDSLPAVIGSQGTWCLASDLSTGLATGAAIQVATNNVTVDCNGFKLGGLAAGAGTGTVGIQATDRLNVVVRDCHVRGFRIAIQGTGGGFQVLGNRLEANTQRAISLSGDHHTIRGNLLTDTGGSTVGNGAAYGVVLSGPGDIIDNTIGDVVATAGSGQGAWGIHAADGAGAAHTNIQGNRIRGLVPDGASSAAIRSVASGRVTILDNSLYGDGVGIGIQCANTTGAVRGNSMLGFATGLSGCPNDGSNVTKL